MDYGHLTEDVEDTSGEHGEEEVSKAGGSLTMLVMKESQHKSVWAYPVERKGAAEEWVSQQLIEDFETIGLQDERIVLKSDQEPAVVDLLREVANQRKAHYGAALEHSAVGESDTNATIERAIQDVEGQIRTLRAALEARFQ